MMRVCVGGSYFRKMLFAQLLELFTMYEASGGRVDLFSYQAKPLDGDPVCNTHAPLLES